MQASPSPTRDTLSTEVRRVLALAWPVTLTSLNWTLLHLTDVAVVGFAGTGEVAALGASRALTYVTIVAGIAWLSGVLVFVSRADGAGDTREAGLRLRTGLCFGLLLGSAMAAILFAFAAPLLAFVGVEAHVVPRAAQVVRAIAFAYPCNFLTIAASYYLEGVSRPRRVLAVNLAMLPANALLAWALTVGALGLPRLGAVGAALATTIVSLFGAALMVASAMSLSRARECSARVAPQWMTALGAMPQLVRFGFIPAIAAALELGGFAILIALSTQLGTTAAHAFQIVFSVHNLTFALALGLGSAAGVRAGNAVGEGRPEAARRRTLIAVSIAIGLTALAALIVGLSARPLAGLFPATGQVHVLAAAMLPWWAPFILFDGAQVVFVYALRSLGDQVAAGMVSIIAFFLLTGGAGGLLVAHGFGPFALVWASGIGMVAAALLQGGRFLWVSRPSRQSSG